MDLMTNFTVLVTNIPGAPPQNEYFYNTEASNGFYRVILQGDSTNDEEVLP